MREPLGHVSTCLWTRDLIICHWCTKLDFLVWEYCLVCTLFSAGYFVSFMHDFMSSGYPTYVPCHNVHIQPSPTYLTVILHSSQPVIPNCHPTLSFHIHIWETHSSAFIYQKYRIIIIVIVAGVVVVFDPFWCHHFCCITHVPLSFFAIAFQQTHRFPHRILYLTIIMW
jgi:hypothetical protein